MKLNILDACNVQFFAAIYQFKKCIYFFFMEKCLYLNIW